MTAITALPKRSATLLEKLCSEADKSQGVADSRTFELFCKFSAMAHHENATLTPEAVNEHLKEKGWPQEQADAAAKRYKAASLLLNIYDKVKAGELND